MTSRKPTAGFWITVALVAVLVGYPLSFGPACWLMSRSTIGRDAIMFVYQPIDYAWMHGPERAARCINWYCYAGSDRDWYWGSPGYMPPAMNGWYPRHWPYRDRDACP